MSATVSYGELLEIGPLQILPDEYLVRAGGGPLVLTRRELRLLTELARGRERIKPREELFRLASGREMHAADRPSDVYVRKLGVKLRQALPEWRFIHTHIGFGSRLAAEPAAVGTTV